MIAAKSLIRQLGLVLPLLVLGFAARIASAQSDAADAGGVAFTTLYSFDGTDGTYPKGTLVQATNGDLYGTTGVGGTVYKMTPSGTLTTLYNFCSPSECPKGINFSDGQNPQAGLIQATNGDLYGTAHQGGANNAGTVFRITPSGTLTPLYSFCQANCADGAGPYAGLMQAANGDLYGTTVDDINGGGTVFKITPSGVLTTLYNFCSHSKCSDGMNPWAGLVQADDGDLYGTTLVGGANSPPSVMGGAGTIFKITPSGTLTTLYSFCAQVNCADGEFPYAGLIQGADGNLYGTTAFGGANSAGTVFRITPSGTLTTLYSFCTQANCADGEAPYAGLVQATDGDFYGTTGQGGDNGHGTIFKITANGALTTLYRFCSQAGCADGELPFAALVQDTNGDLYGTTVHGGSHGDFGTVFALSIGQTPFVETRPSAAPAASAVTILGSDLTGTTSVTFNGTPAMFTVVSGREITTNVPADAITGKVQVITPGGTLSSNVAFEVVP
jgi:uncharacterized repeat protein (TIGR03803 family)